MNGSDSDLFRREALRATRNDVLGKVSVAVPMSRWIYSSVAAMFAVALVTYGWLGHYTRRIRVAGELVPSAGLITLSTTQGMVLRVYAHEGQHVKKGQPLLEFSNPLDTSKLGNARDVISAELNAQREALEHELDTQQRLARNNAEELSVKLASQKKQILELEAQLTLQESQVKVYAKRLEMVTPLLHNGYISQYQVQQEQTELLSSQEQVKALARQLLDLRNQLNQTKQEITIVPLNLASQEVTTRSHLDELRQSLVQNEGQRAWVLRAPEDGLITSSLVKAGQTVSTGKPLLSILPQNSLLDAQLLVPDDAIGFVRTGQHVALRYNAYPYQEFGQYLGIVSSVSRSALSPSEVESLFDRHVEKPQYRVVVQLDRQAVDDHDSASPLIPGMTVNADIFLDRRRLVEWVIGPLTGFVRRTQGEHVPAKLQP